MSGDHIKRLESWFGMATIANKSQCGCFSCGAQALERGPSSGGAQAELLHDMWDLPRPGVKPVSPSLAGAFLTIGLPGKPCLE